MNHMSRLLVLAAHRHYRHAGRVYAPAAYVKELEIYADWFAEVVVVAETQDGVPPLHYGVFSNSRLRTDAPFQLGRVWWRRVLSAPLWLAWLLGQMWRADAIHARCPGLAGFIGILLGPLLCRRLVAHYEQSWARYRREPALDRLQRLLLKSAWWHGPVTVYGRWRRQGAKVTSLFGCTLTGEQLARGRLALCRPRPADKLRVLCVGPLRCGKKAKNLLRAIARTPTTYCRVTATICNPGAARPLLEGLAASLGITDRICVTTYEEPGQLYGLFERADVLVLARHVKDWPQLAAEAMAFGLVCIVPDEGLCPQLVAKDRGLAVGAGDLEALCLALSDLATHPAKAAEMRGKAARWGQLLTTELLRQTISQLVHKAWNTNDLRQEPAATEPSTNAGLDTPLPGTGLRVDRARPPLNSY